MVRNKWHKTSQKAYYSNKSFRRAGIGLPSGTLLFCYLEFVAFLESWDSSSDHVDVFEMAAKVPALSKVFKANLALIRPCHRVLSEVVTQIAALTEDRLTLLIAASEVQLCPLGLLIAHFYGLVPGRRYSIKVLYKSCVRSLFI